MVTVYSPVGTDAKAKTPSELLTVRRMSPESWFFSVMLALGTTAPDWSVTVPVSCPVRFCPYPAANAEQSRANANTAPNTLLYDFIYGSPLLRGDQWILTGKANRRSHESQ